MTRNLMRLGCLLCCFGLLVGGSAAQITANSQITIEQFRQPTLPNPAEYTPGPNAQRLVATPRAVQPPLQIAPSQSFDRPFVPSQQPPPTAAPIALTQPATLQAAVQAPAWLVDLLLLVLLLLRASG